TRTLAAEFNADVASALRHNGVAEVDESPLTRGMYSTDASLYRVVPQVVVRPRHVEEVLATVATCAATQTQLTSMGGGTAIGGNAVGPGVVMDLARQLNQLGPVDPDTATAEVEPRCVHATLQAAAAPHGLRFGPDPSTHSRCTVGGMIGNNACGSRALGYGRTADNVRALDVVTVGGERLQIG